MNPKFPVHCSSTEQSDIALSFKIKIIEIDTKVCISYHNAESAMNNDTSTKEVLVT